MWTLSGFSDEISTDFETQCTVVARLGLHHLEFRSAWNVNILDLDPDQLGSSCMISSAAHDAGGCGQLSGG